MKIALFHTTLPEKGRKPGGVEVAVHRLANQLAEDPRDDVTVFSLTPPPDLARYKHEYIFASRPGLKDKQLLRLFVLPFLLNFVRLKEYDIVHFHGDDWFVLRRAFPSVRTLHGSALYEARSASSLKRKIAQYCVYPLEHLARRLSTIPLAIGPKTAHVYQIADLANNGVDLSLFRQGAKAPHPQILYVGTWEGRKRGAFVYEQFLSQVLPECPRAELVMVSDRAPEHKNVRFVHFPDDQTLAELYRTSWVFAYPSVYEGFGIPYIEAMASGTAVVCSPNDGATYVLDNGRYGKVVDDNVFGATVKNLLVDHQAREALIKLGLERAAEFSWEAVAKQHRAIYEKAIIKWNKGGVIQDQVEQVYEY